MSEPAARGMKNMAEECFMGLSDNLLRDKNAIYLTPYH